MNDTDMQMIEEMVEEAKTIVNAGYLDLSHFNECRINAIGGLIKFGGNFAQSLGETLRRADQNNSLKIMRYWQHDCDLHATLYKMWLAKQKAESLESA